MLMMMRLLDDGGGFRCSIELDVVVSLELVGRGLANARASTSQTANDESCRQRWQREHVIVVKLF